MEERFKQLFAIKEDLYTDNSPVIIEKGVLLLDTKSNKILIQMKFCNIAEKPFKALYILFNTYDTSNVQMSPVEYKYLDINVDYGRSFGTDKAIILENNLVRSFEISKYSIVYENNEIETFSNPFLQLPDSDFLQAKFADEELIKQYCIETSKYSKCVPIQYKNIWKCACGEWNSQDVCWNCKVSKEDIFDRLADSALIMNKEKRLEQEKINKEIQEKQRVQAEKEEQIKKKRIRNIIIAGSVFVVGGVLYTSFVQPYITYQHGKKLLSEKKYDDSIAELAKVDEYKDAKTLIDDAYYQKGESLLEEKKFDEAEEIFESLNSYEMTQEVKRQKGLYLLEQKEYDAAEEIFKDLKDSEMCNEIDYQRALGYISQKEYSKAENLLKWLKNRKYKDSEEQYNEVKYQEGVRFMDAENYPSASAVFQNIKDYKDALSKWEECQYILGKDEMDKKEYEKAGSYFEQIVDNNSNSDLFQKAKNDVLECYYLNGMRWMHDKNYMNAIESFLKSRKYKDSKEKISQCRKIINISNVEELFKTIKINDNLENIRKRFGKPDSIVTKTTDNKQKEQIYRYTDYYRLDNMIGELYFVFLQGDNKIWRLKKIYWEKDDNSLDYKVFSDLEEHLTKVWGEPLNPINMYMPVEDYLSYSAGMSYYHRKNSWEKYGDYILTYTCNWDFEKDQQINTELIVTSE